MQMNSSALWLRLDSPGPSFSEGKGIRAWSLSVGDRDLWPRCKVFSYAVSSPRQTAHEEKFTPAPEKFIFLTWEQNFLSEVGIFGAFQGKAVSKIFSELQKFRQLHTLFQYNTP